MEVLLLLLLLLLLLGKRVNEGGREILRGRKWTVVVSIRGK
jgi:hypothetical protein